MFAVLIALALSAPPPPPGPDVKGETADLQPLAGRLVSFDDKAGLTVADAEGKTRTVPAADLIALSLPEAGAPAPAGSAIVFLRNGDVVAGAIAGGDENNLRMRLAEGLTLEIPLTEIGAVGTNAATDREARWPAAALAAPPAEDRLLLANGDAAAGLITGFADDSVLVSPAAGGAARPYKLDRVARIVLSKVGDPAGLKPGQTGLRLRLADGSVLTAAAWSITPETAAITLPSGAKLAGLKIAMIEAVSTVNGRAVHLSDLEPTEAVQTPFLESAPPSPPVRDRNVLGGPLSVNGRRHHKGWGVQSKTRLTFATAGGYKRFVSGFGIDDRVAGVTDPATGEPYADCVFRVYVDGKLRFEKAGVRWGRSHPRIELDVTGAKTITLEVDYGANDGIQDRADWVDCVLIR